MEPNGQLYIISAPSGAGKTSLVRALITREDYLHMSVSHTTRECRSGEIDATDYHFVSVDQFKAMLGEHAFLEYAEVFGNFYGTSKRQVEALLQQGLDVILEIDWQGARQVRTLLPDAISIFVLPPSLQALHDRLMGRAQDDETVIRQRMQAAQHEMVHYDEFEYLVVNDVFDEALNELRSIIECQRLKQSRQRQNHHELLKTLLG